MPDNDLNARFGLDSTDFKAGITSLRREIRVVDSGFRASSASLGDWAKSATGLEMRMKSLKKEMEVQGELVKRMRTEYERVAAAEGAASKETKEMEIKLNKEIEALGKMEAELRKSKTALDKMGGESGQTGRQLDDLGDKEDKLAKKTLSLKDVMHGLGDGLKVGLKTIAAVGAAAVAATGAIAGMVLKAADAAGELVDLSIQTGIDVEKLQEMQYVGGQLGVSTETMAGAFARLTKNMGKAQDGTGEAFDAFQRLGIPVADMNGNLRDSEDVFQDAVDALGGVSNETERDALAMALFGKSAQELNGLIEADSDEIFKLTKEAHDMGAVMDKEAVEGLESFGDEIEGLKGGAKGMMGTLAAAFLPGFRGITGAAKDYMKQLSKILSGSDGDLAKMAAGIGELLGTIISDIAKKLPKIMDAGLGILQGLINAIVQNLPVMIPAVIAIINAIVQFIIQNLPLLITAVIQIIMALVNGLFTQAPMLLKAAIQIIVTLAQGISKAIPELLPVITEIIPEIIIALIESLPLLIDAALEMILVLVDGLIIALPVLIAAVPQIMTALIEAFTLMWPKVKEAGERLIDQVTTGIANAWPSIKSSGNKIGEIWINGVRENFTRMKEVGTAIVNAVWVGIKEKAAWFYDQVTRFFSDLIKSVKDTIDWHSPPGKFIEIGAGMAQALGIGFTGAFGQVDREITKAIKALSAPETSLAFAGAGGGNRSQTQALAPVTVNANVASNIDIHRLARAVADEQARQRR